MVNENSALTGGHCFQGCVLVYWVGLGDSQSGNDHILIERYITPKNVANGRIHDI